MKEMGVMEEEGGVRLKALGDLYTSILLILCLLFYLFFVFNYNGSKTIFVYKAPFFIIA